MRTHSTSIALLLLADRGCRFRTPSKPRSHKRRFSLSVRLPAVLFLLFASLGARAQQPGNILFQPVPAIPKIAFIRVSFVGTPSLFGPEQLTQVKSAVIQTYLENSYQRCDPLIDTNIPVIALPNTRQYYRSNEYPYNAGGLMYRDLVAQAAAMNVNLAQYDYKILFSAKAWGINPNYAWGGGFSGFGLPVSFVGRIYAADDLTEHELGHNLSLGHASFWNDEPRTTFPDPGDNCAHDEYGDVYDIMGWRAGGPWEPVGNRHLNPMSKARLGWLTDNEHVSMWGMGSLSGPTTRTFILRGIEQTPVSHDQITSGLEIPVSSTLSYRILYRSQQPNAIGGALIIATGNNGRSTLLDANRAGESACYVPRLNNQDAPLTPDMGWFPLRAVKGAPPEAEIRTLSVGEGHAVVEVRANTVLDSRRPPVVDIVQPALFKAFDSYPVTYEVTAYDPSTAQPYVGGAGIASVDLKVQYLLISTPGTRGTWTDVKTVTFTQQQASYQTQLTKAEILASGATANDVTFRLVITATTTGPNPTSQQYSYQHWLF